MDRETGMVIDFSILKDASRHVDEIMDHMTLLQSTDPVAEALATIQLEGDIVFFSVPPTVEAICVLVGEEIKIALSKYSPATTYPRLTKVIIKETETGVASITL